MRNVFIVVLAAFAMLAAASPASAGKKKKEKKYDTWNLKMVFIVGSDDWKTHKGRAEIDAWIKEQVHVAEQTYKDRPRLDISYSIQRKTSLGGKNLANPTFKNNKEYNKWMDRHVDNIANSKTSGHMTILVVDSFCIKNKKKKAKKTGKAYKCPGGRAWFPHWVNPFSRKYGISLLYKNAKHTLAHEIGHFLSLKHTFEPYVNVDAKLNCNKDWKKGAKGKCDTCTGKVDGNQCTKSSNVMDYCFGPRYTLNDCQKRRAARQRYQYMTNKGETNYKKLTGRR